jgi:hypothetical protein
LHFIFYLMEILKKGIQMVATKHLTMNSIYNSSFLLSKLHVSNIVEDLARIGIQFFYILGKI